MPIHLKKKTTFQKKFQFISGCSKLDIRSRWVHIRVSGKLMFILLRFDFLQFDLSQFKSFLLGWFGSFDNSLYQVCSNHNNCFLSSLDLIHRRLRIDLQYVWWAWKFSSDDGKHASEYALRPRLETTLGTHSIVPKFVWSNQISRQSQKHIA
jgi:hypothetical protein